MIKKHLITVIWLLCIWQPFVYADFSENDCRIVINWADRALKQYTVDLNSQWSTLVDEKTIWQALQNLYNHCDNKVWWAESNFIFDHLIDLSFRKLDAYADPTLRYNLSEDTKWKEWQKLVTDFANPANNAKPEQVIQAFNTYRPSKEVDSTIYVTSNTCEIPNTNTLSLRGRYKASCLIAKCLSQKRWLIASDITNKTSAIRLDEKPDTCDILSENRYQSEVSYVKQLVARVWIRTINNLIEQYTKNYFVWNRRESLYEQFTSFNQNLSFVNRKIQEGTPVCSSK